MGCPDTPSILFILSSMPNALAAPAPGPPHATARFCRSAAPVAPPETKSNVPPPNQQPPYFPRRPRHCASTRLGPPAAGAIACAASAILRLFLMLEPQMQMQEI